jgi:hypothetical protein
MDVITGGIGDVRNPGEAPSRDGTTLVHRGGFPYSLSTYHTDDFLITIWWKSYTKSKIYLFVGPLHL